MSAWPRVLVLILAGCSLGAAPALASRNDWKPIDPAHLFLRSSTIDPGAGAEALFWEVHVEDVRMPDNVTTELDHYVRIKVFDGRGVASQSTIDIEYGADTRITDVRGRTIQQDGTIVPLGSDAVFDRVTVKVGGVKHKKRSFAMPAVEPGAILEYRYRERRMGSSAHYLRLYFQRDIPVRSVTYFIKPLDFPGYGMKSRTYHGTTGGFVPAEGGFKSITATNVPAVRDEPFMPPKDQVRFWMLIYYSPSEQPEANEFWKDYAVATHRAWKGSMKVNSEIRNAVEEAVGDAAEPEQKLRRIYDWCRAKVKNRADEATGMTEEQKDELKQNKKPVDALKRGTGSPFDINMVFGALCSAADFEVRVAKLSDRSDLFFDPTFADGYFLRTYDIAVKVGDRWKLFDPGSPSTPFGRLRWQEEGVDALICDPAGPTWVETPMAGAQDSRTLRTADVRLDADGNLEGDVRIETTGHRAAARRGEWLEEAPEKREQWIKDEVVASISTAEVSQVEFEHGLEHDLPFAYRYHVRVPGYAQKTGKRQLLRPGFFQNGEKSLFPASERVHPVYFAYPWSSVDSVRIEVPENWEMESGDSPQPARAEGLCSYEATVGLGSAGRRIVWTRHFEFGAEGTVFFPRDQYAGLKRLFDTIADRDEHAVTLRPVASASE